MVSFSRRAEKPVCRNVCEDGRGGEGRGEERRDRGREAERGFDVMCDDDKVPLSRTFTFVASIISSLFTSSIMNSLAG